MTGFLAAMRADALPIVHSRRRVSSALPATVVQFVQLGRGDKFSVFVGTRTDLLCCPFSLFDGSFETKTVYSFLSHTEISSGRGQRSRKRTVIGVFCQAFGLADMTPALTQQLIKGF